MIQFYFSENNNSLKKGFTIIESVIGIALFLIIAFGIYQAYINLMETARLSRIKLAATELANEQFEIIRNLTYPDVGVQGSIPSGKIPREKFIIRNNVEFKITTTIRNIDDPFDGTIGGTPNDLSPADYKLVALDIGCVSCKNFKPVSFTTQISPRALETSSKNGALFVRVFDAVGQPVVGANVHIENNQNIPPIIINDTTNNDGFLQIVDAPTGTEAYQIEVSELGYSQDRTYPVGGPQNPNPLKPHATVATQQLTQISFAIDKTSAFNISSVNQTCVPMSNVNFFLRGSKIIGTNPDVFKYNQSYTTDGGGNKIISGLEWDTYNLFFTDVAYDLVGTIPLLPLSLNPGNNQDIKFIVASKRPKSLLITVKDGSTQLPLSDVNVMLARTGYNKTLVTGRGFLRQTDWSGGLGQENFIDETKYFDSDWNIDGTSYPGELHLAKFLDNYQYLGYLISSTFDAGSASNWHQILWQPLDQLPEVGPDSIKLQLATNNDKATWNFVGPDGTSDTFYTINDTNINSAHNGDRYLRYKIIMTTVDTSFTPIFADIQFTFTSACVPPGQVMFTYLNSGDYDLTVSKNGYQEFNDSLIISSSWQQSEVILNP